MRRMPKLSRKHKGIHTLLRRLDLTARGWVVVDHWDADLLAIGIAAECNPRRLVYVSIDHADPDHYQYVCEVPNGPEPTDFQHGRSAEDALFDELLIVLEEHLGGERGR